MPGQNLVEIILNNKDSFFIKRYVADALIDMTYRISKDDPFTYLSEIEGELGDKIRRTQMANVFLKLSESEEETNLIIQELS